MHGWLNCGIETQVNWPSVQKEIVFEGRPFVLMPPTAKTIASVHVQLKGLTNVEGMTAVNRLLSHLAWLDDQPAINHYGWSGNPAPVAVPRQQSRLGYSPTDYFPSSISAVIHPKAKLALALFREGKSLNSIPYQFLSFFKILNIFWNDKTGKDRKNDLKEGLRLTLPKISDDRATALIRLLQEDGIDPVDYLYKSCRCAVAHAFSDPTVDPDDVSELHRLSDALPLIESLAAHMIEHELKIQR